MRPYALILTIGFSHSLMAQVNQLPTTSKLFTFNFFESPSLKQPYQFTPSNTNTLRYSIGNDFIEEQNRLILQQNEMLINASNEQLKQTQPNEIQEAFMELDADYRHRQEWLDRITYYRYAFERLNELYNSNFSLTNATYLVENAFLDGRLSYDMFTGAIKSKALLIKQILRREQLDSNSNLALNYGIQKLFNQANIYYDLKTKLVTTNAQFKYDFEDIRGEKDYTKMFTFKLLATGKGQCHSMPLVYLMVAEQLNTKAWLSLAPQHSFIQFLDNHNNLINFETTNGTIVSTNWLLQSGFINANALRSKTYLDTLSQKQLFAQSLSDLLLGYLQKFGYDEFAEQVRQRILQVNPNNLTASIVDANIKKAIAFQQIIAAGKPPEKDLPQYPDAYKAYTQMRAAFDKVDNMGYQDMPEKAYQNWLRSIDMEKQKQKSRELKEKMQREIQSLKKVKSTFTNKPQR